MPRVRGYLSITQPICCTYVIGLTRLIKTATGAVCSFWKTGLIFIDSGCASFPITLGPKNKRDLNCLRGKKKQCLIEGESEKGHSRSDADLSHREARSVSLALKIFFKKEDGLSPRNQALTRERASEAPNKFSLGRDRPMYC
jgi:hypothetical protein